MHNDDIKSLSESNVVDPNNFSEDFKQKGKIEGIVVDNSDELDKEDENKDLKKHFHLTSWNLAMKASKFKGECFLKSFCLSILIFLFISVIVEKDYGVINIISKSTSTNHYFLALVIGKTN